MNISFKNRLSFITFVMRHSLSDHQVPSGCCLPFWPCSKAPLAFFDPCRTRTAMHTGGPLLSFRKRLFKALRLQGSWPRGRANLPQVGSESCLKFSKRLKKFGLSVLSLANGPGCQVYSAMSAKAMASSNFAFNFLFQMNPK